jgi:DNA-binding NarL/FixJ family response regulator
LWAPPEIDGAAPQKGERERILIVEDDYFVAIELEHRLQEAGYEVIGIATTASEAVEFAREGNPALAIMDIRLAGNSDGVDAAIKLADLYNVPSIFASAHSDAHTRQRAERARPRGWVSKPYSPETVIAAVRAALQP